MNMKYVKKILPITKAQAWFDEKGRFVATVSDAPTKERLIHLVEKMEREREKASRKPYFIVEHPTRGVFVGWDDKPKFSPTKSRSQCTRFTTLEGALVKAVFGGMPAKCFVVEMPAGKVIRALPTTGRLSFATNSPNLQNIRPPQKPEVRARSAALRKALVVALRGLSEEEIVDILADNWASLHRIDLLKDKFP